MADTVPISYAGATRQADLVAGAITSDTVSHALASNVGNAAVGTSAVTLMPANPNRIGFSIQNQSATGDLYFRIGTNATADFNALKLGPGDLYETSVHAGRGLISVIATVANTPVFAREW